MGVPEIADQVDLPGVGALTIATVVLGLVFRTLWRQDGTWRMLIDEERKSSDASRDDAAAARKDAAYARAEAREAREEAERLRLELISAREENRLAWAAHAKETERVDHLVAALRQAGVPLPQNLN